MTHIIGDKGKPRKYDPDLARRVNEADEKARRQGKLRETEPEKAIEDMEVDIGVIWQNFEEYIYGDKEGFDRACSVVEELNLVPTVKQVGEFGKSLGDYSTAWGIVKTLSAKYHNCMVYYLSALMNVSEGSKDKPIILDFTELNKKGIIFNNFGYKLKGKRVDTEGNFANNFGVEAEDCMFVIRNGNVGNDLGYGAKNCEIYVHGNVGERIGNRAQNCKIVLREEDSYKGLSVNIGKGTRVILYIGAQGKEIYP